MTKRTNPAGSSTPQKRTKTTGGTQLRLDGFFSPSKPTTSLSANKPQGPIEIIDLDSPDDEVLVDASLPPTASTSASPAAIVTTKRPFDMQSAKPAQVDYPALDVNPTVYAPDDRPWTSTGEAPYSFLAHALQAISQTKSRNSILNILTNTLLTLIACHPPSLLPSLYLLSNTLAPPYSALELGIGGSLLSKSIQNVSGLSAAALRSLYNTTGDVGDVAHTAKSKVRTLVPHAPLTINGVYNSLLKISRCKGQGASQQKGRIIEQLLVAGNGEEVRYLVRTLAQNLRVGAVRTTILTALARAIAIRPPTTVSDPSLHVSRALLDHAAHTLGKRKSFDAAASQGEIKAIFSTAETLVKEVYAQHPCYDDIVAALLQDGLSTLSRHVPLTVGIPLLPALGSPTRSLDEIYDRLGDTKFAAEFKYDGQRAQIHAKVEQEGHTIIRIFSRHLEDMTSKYPDVVALIENLLRCSTSMTSFIIDSEIVAIDIATGELKTFQELSNRSRKDVKLADIKVSVSVFAFDLLYINTEPLLQKSFRERRDLLRTRFAPIVPQDRALARFDFVECLESAAGKSAVAEFFRKAVASRCEGLMIKVLDSTVVGEKDTARSTRRSLLPASYEPDKRTASWLKLKKDYVEGLSDSLDMIPIGAWYGNGRKVGWWSPILLGLWDLHTGRVVAMCKCMSGFTDTFYKNLTETYSLQSDDCSDQPIWEVECGGFKPDVFFRPKEVWEIRGADITESPVSLAARNLIPGGRGLSLRFPRFVGLRPDKSTEQASSPGFLANIWRQQSGKSIDPGVDDGDLVDPTSDEGSVYVSEWGPDL